MSNQRSWIIIVVLLVVGGAVVLGLKRRADPPAEAAANAVRPTLVETVQVARQPLSETITISGTLQSTKRVEIAAQLPSRVVRRPVREGSHVQRGDLLLQLDDTEIEAGIARAQAAVAARAAQLRKATLGLSTARSAATAQQQQARGGREAAEANAEQARLGVGLTAAGSAGDIASAKAGVEAAKAQLSQAELAAKLARQEADADVADAGAALTAAEADVQRAKAGAGVKADAAQADFERAQAGLAAAQADLARVNAGARPEQIAAAQANLRQAQAGRDRARKEVEDLEFLHRNGGVSGSDLAGARTQLSVLEAQVDGAAAQLKQAQAGATAEERAAAEAQVAAAQAGLKAARAGLSRAKVSAAEVAAAEAQRDRARQGRDAAVAARGDRIKVRDEQVRAARTDLQRAEAGLTLAQASTGRVAVGEAGARAAEANVTTARGAEAAATVAGRQVELLQADLEAASAALTEARAQSRLALAQLDRTRVTAPLSGTIATLSVNVGDTVLPGMPLAVIETANASELEALCTAEQRAQLRPGQPAKLSVAGIEQPLEGFVREVSPSAEADGRTFRVRLTVAEAGLPPGLSAAAEVRIAHEDAALSVPLAAVQDAAGDQPYVFVRKGTKAVRRSVTLGLRGAEAVEVTGGLADGDEVILDGAATLYDGAPVELKAAPGTGG